MKNLKKFAAILAVMAVSMTAFAACGGTTTETETPTEAATEAATEATTEEVTTEETTEATTEATTSELEGAVVDYAAALSNTCWVGMDTDSTCYALGFSDEEVYIGCDDGSEVRGYWGIGLDDAVLYIYEDQELTNQIGSLDWEYDEQNDVMVIKDHIVLTQVEADSMDAVMEELEKMSVAKLVAQALEGTFWYGTCEDDGSATLLYMDEDKFSFIELDPDGTQDGGVYYWGLTYDALTLYDGRYFPVTEFEWNAAQDMSWLSIGYNGNEITLEQIDADQANALTDFFDNYTDAVNALAEQAAAAEEEEYYEYDDEDAEYEDDEASDDEDAEYEDDEDAEYEDDEASDDEEDEEYDEEADEDEE